VGLPFDSVRGALNGVSIAGALFIALAPNDSRPGGVKGGIVDIVDDSSVLELCLLLFVGEVGATGSESNVSEVGSSGSGVSSLFLFVGESEGGVVILAGGKGSISTLGLHPIPKGERNERSEGFREEERAL
jgi:hypothetical protein